MFVKKKYLKEYCVKIYEIDPYFYRHYKENNNNNKKK